MGRLRIEVGESLLAEEHDKLLRAMTRGGFGAWVEPAEAPISGYSEEALEGARSLWRRRMVQEHNSSAVWAGVLPQLVHAETTLDLKTAVLRAGLDELRHAQLCAQVLRALGTEPEAEAELELTPVARHADCPPLERPLRNLLFIGCLAETVAVAVTAEERQLCSEPYVRTGSVTPGGKKYCTISEPPPVLTSSTSFLNCGELASGTRTAPR